MTRALLTAVVTLQLSGCALVYDDCGDCGSCLPALELAVVDAVTGEAVAPVHITGDLSRASSDETITCSGSCAFGDRAGTYSLVVEALGYEPQEVTVVVPESRGSRCCDCGYNHTNHEVRLEPNGYECEHYAEEFDCCCEGAGCAADQACVLPPALATTISDAGRCVAAPPEGSCWTDEDCSSDEWCSGARLCPCSASCIEPDAMGECLIRR